MHGVEMVADVSDVRHRADQAEVPGQEGQARMKLGELHAGDRGGNGLVRSANLGRRLRFQVPRVEMAGPAAEQNVDARLLGGAAAKSALGVDACGHRPRQPESQRADPAGLEQPAAGNPSRPLSLAVA